MAPLFFLIVWAVAAVGWITNIVKIVGTDLTTITGEIIIRCIGIFLAPLGAVMGYL